MCQTQMNYSQSDLNLLYSMVERNIISLKKAIDWCYAQFTERGAPDWIESLTLSSDKKEFLDILKSRFSVTGALNFEMQVGEVVFNYKHKLISLRAAIDELLFDIYPDKEELKQEKAQLYKAEDYYGWHDSADQAAFDSVSGIFGKYYPKYEEAREKSTHNKSFNRAA